MREERKFNYCLTIDSEKVNFTLFEKLCDFLGGDFVKQFRDNPKETYEKACNDFIVSSSRLQGSLKEFKEKYDNDNIFDLNYLIIKHEKNEISYISSRTPNLEESMKKDVKWLITFSRFFNTVRFDVFDNAIILHQYLYKNDNSQRIYTVFEGTDKEFKGNLKEIAENFDLDYKKFSRDMNKNGILKALNNDNNSIVYTIFKNTDKEFTGTKKQIFDHLVKEDSEFKDKIMESDYFKNLF